MILSGTVAVPENAVTVDVLGSFGVGYVVGGLVPDWATGTDSSAQVPSQFTVTFTSPAPDGGGNLQWIVDTAAAQAAVAPEACVLAGALISRLRSKIGDNVWVGGVAQPEVDGKFRVVELYGWLQEAIAGLTQLTGWTVDDWYAMPLVIRQPWYVVDPKFISMREAFSQHWPLGVSNTEGQTIWPNTLGAYTTQRALTAFWRRVATQLEVGVWPSPAASDPATTLSGAINASGNDPILVASTTDFLTYGYVRIEDEILQYQERVTTPASIGTISRGVCGTTAAAHANGATVQHLGFWIKGKRLPQDIVNSLSCVEVPRGWQHHLETYVLAQCRFARNKHQEGVQLMGMFERSCAGINADPNWKPNRTGYIRAWGDHVLGGLYGRSPFGTVVP